MDIHYKNSHEPVMETPELELAKFQIETSKKITVWTNALIRHPERFDELEHDIDQYYRNASGRIVATLGQVAVMIISRLSPYEFLSANKRSDRKHLICGAKDASRACRRITFGRVGFDDRRCVGEGQPLRAFRPDD